MKKALKNLLKRLSAQPQPTENSDEIERIKNPSLDPELASYYDIQIERTLAKKNAPISDRVMELGAILKGFKSIEGCRVLSIGCRNIHEIEYLEKLGAKEVIGIDLFSESPKIRIMDMHNLTFPEATFDIVFSCHSFEHSLFPAKAANEIRRVLKNGGFVAIEVPINFGARGADVQDYLAGENILALFGTGVKPHLVEDIKSGSSKNTTKLDIARLILEINHSNV